FPRPGGNVTGFTVSEPTLAAKWLQLLKEMGPQIARVAMLFNPATAQYAEFYLNSFKAAAIPLAVKAILAPVHKASDLDSVFATQAREPNSGLIAMRDSFTMGNRVEITSLAAAVPSSVLAVPASLHSSLMSRLDRLGPAKAVAQIGAAIGREFSHPLLAAVV